MRNREVVIYLKGKIILEIEFLRKKEVYLLLTLLLK